MPAPRRVVQKFQPRGIFDPIFGSSSTPATSPPTGPTNPPTQSNKPPTQPTDTTPKDTAQPTDSKPVNTAKTQSKTQAEKPDPTEKPTASQDDETTKSAKSDTESSVSKTASNSKTKLTDGNTFLNTAGLVPPTGASGLSITPTFTGANGLSSATPSATPVAGLNTGVIVGGIAGGLALLALLGFIITFFIRRRREREREEEFAAAQDNRRSIMTWGGLSEARPLSIFGRRWGGAQAAAPSINEGFEGGNMAGRGVNHYQTDAYASSMQQTAGAPASQGLQPRPQYTFGESAPAVQVVDSGGDDPEEEAGGAYSAQPQMQNVYNLEAYGHYDNYAYPSATDVHPPAARAQAHEEDAYGGI